MKQYWPWVFHRNDIVCVEKDKETVMKLQEGHSGWKPGMASVGLSFTITSVCSFGSPFVFHGSTRPY